MKFFKRAFLCGCLSTLSSVQKVLVNLQKHITSAAAVILKQVRRDK
jgi:hypothetical protein